MNPLTTSWMFFPSHVFLSFAPTANHGMDRLLLAGIVSERRSQQSSLVPDYPEDVLPKTPTTKPMRSFSSDVPTPEPFDVPVPEPMDIPPPSSEDVPPPDPRDMPHRTNRPRSVP